MQLGVRLSDLDPRVQILELHEEFVQNIEQGSGRIKTMSILTMIVAVFLFASYFYQILLPITSGVQYVQVNLRDPILLVTQGILIVLTFAWLYVGAVNFLFYRRLNSTIKLVRAKEKEIENRIEKGMTE